MHVLYNIQKKLYKFGIFSDNCLQEIRWCQRKSHICIFVFSLAAGKFMKLGKHALYNLIKNFSGR